MTELFFCWFKKAEKKTTETGYFTGNIVITKQKLCSKVISFKSSTILEYINFDEYLAQKKTYTILITESIHCEF